MKYRVKAVHPRRHPIGYKQNAIAMQASLLDISNEAVFALDTDGVILYWNKAAEQMYGYSSQEAVGRVSHVLLKTVHPIDSLNTNDKAGGREAEHTTKDGRKLEVETYKQIITDASGQSMMLETNRDITDRKMAERALQKSEQHHRLAAVGAALGTYIYNFETGEDDWSPELYAIWGLKPGGDRGELDDDRLYKAMHPDDRQTFVEKRAKANDPQGPGVFDVNFRVVRPDGSIRWIHVRGLTTFQGVGEDRHPVYSAGTAMDITEQKIMEKRLLDSSHFIHEILESINDGFFFLDKDWRFSYINNKAANTFGHAVDELILQNIWEVFPHILGTAIEVHFKNVMRNKAQIKFQMSGILTNRHYFFSVYPAAEGISVYLIDVTERVELETKIGEQNSLLVAVEKEKVESLKKQIEMKDEFLLTITHEFKTPLSIINSALQTMEFTCSKDITSRIRKYHDIIRQNSNRQLRLVNNLLDVTRMDAGSLKTYKNNLEIVALTRSILNSITVFCEQKNLKLSFSSTMLHRVIGIDEEKYERILLNLLSNAVKFTSAGQSIAVSLYRKTVHGKKMVCVEVRDTGIGIPKDKIDVIFEKFGQVGSTRTRQAEGSGIGLHLVKLLVELLGGAINVESELGLGSTFTVFLPDQKADEAEHTAQMAQIKSDHRLIAATALEFSDFYMD